MQPFLGGKHCFTLVLRGRGKYRLRRASRGSVGGICVPVFLHLEASGTSAGGDGWAEKVSGGVYDHEWQPRAVNKHRAESQTEHQTVLRLGRKRIGSFHGNSDARLLVTAVRQLLLQPQSCCRSCSGNAASLGVWL